MLRFGLNRSGTGSASDADSPSILCAISPLPSLALSVRLLLFCVGSLLTIMASRDALHLSADLRAKLAPFLPPLTADSCAPERDDQRPIRPFVTLTYAMSLDAMIAAAPGTQTLLSGQASKAMTHFLRTRHDAICVGAGTAIADNPTLNSRLTDAIGNLALQPRPVVLDRRARWHVSRQSKVIQAASNGLGLGPWIVCDAPSSSGVVADALDACDGAILTDAGRDLPDILQSLQGRGISSIMIEGGSEIIKGMLSRHPDLIDSLIITIAPVFLGDGGVNVAPSKSEHLRLTGVTWIPLEADVVMCSHVEH